MANMQEFPPRRAGLSASVPSASSDGDSHRSGAAAVHLLVVDDDMHIRELCRSVAEESGMKVFDVSTAEEALQAMELSPVDILPYGFAPAGDERSGIAEACDREAPGCGRGHADAARNH